ncbi:MAG: lysine--tRNA ligase [Zavarzinella sp.]
MSNDQAQLAAAGDAHASRMEKLRKIEEMGIDPWGARFDDHIPVEQILQKPCVGFDQEPTEKVRAAGRIVLRRTMGKAHFLQIRDMTGTIQVWLGKNQLGDDGWNLAMQLDLGDIIGVDGVFGRTKTGEPTIRGEQLTFLSKSLEPHPEKFHGMQDMEYRLRHRYLDLVYTPETLVRAKQRVLILRTIRRYLDELGYMEVESPTLHAIAGGAAARPFGTHHNALDIDLFMRIALELPLKKLLIGGIEKVYEIGRVFRNEGISQRHNPEFTMMELYQAYGNYHTMMELTEGVLVSCVRALNPNGSLTIPYGEFEVDFTPPFQRASYYELFEKHVGCSGFDPEAVAKRAAESKIPLTMRDASGEAIQKEHDVLVQELFEHYVEDALIGPVFVCDYPAALCPLTKRKRDNPAVAERFELFVRGMELANAYTELNDPILQESTFRKQLTGMNEEDSMAKMDDDFILAQRHGMPPAGGLGIGIDRLVMLLTNTQSIRDVILFPLLRPQAN